MRDGILRRAGLAHPAATGLDAATSRPAVRWSGTRKRSAAGNGSAGRRLKKSPERRAHHRLRRRKRTERAAPPETHLGAPGANARAAISLYLEDAFRRGRHHLLEFLLSAVCRVDPQRAGHRVPGASAPACGRQGADRVGRPFGASQPGGAGVRAPTAAGASGWSFFPLTRRN